MKMGASLIVSVFIMFGLPMYLPTALAFTGISVLLDHTLSQIFPQSPLLRETITTTFIALQNPSIACVNLFNDYAGKALDWAAIHLAHRDKKMGFMEKTFLLFLLNQSLNTGKKGAALIHMFKETLGWGKLAPLSIPATKIILSGVNTASQKLYTLAEENIRQQYFDLFNAEKNNHDTIEQEANVHFRAEVNHTKKASVATEKTPLYETKTSGWIDSLINKSSKTLHYFGTSTLSWMSGKVNRIPFFHTPHHCSMNPTYDRYMHGGH